MLRGYKKYIILMLLCLTLFSAIQTVNAVYNEHQSYIYNQEDEIIPAPQAYIKDKIIDSQTLGISEFQGARDLFVSEDQMIYLVDTEGQRIIVINENWEVINIIDSYIKNGSEERFASPNSVFVQGNKIHISDSDKKKIIILNLEGEFISDIGTPQETDVEGMLFEDMDYSPQKLVVDSIGNKLVISDYITHGFVKFDLEGNFQGFMGAPEAAPNPLDAFWYRVSPAERRERMANFVPIRYNNVDSGYRGLIYGLTANSIRVLNSAGTLLEEFQEVGDPELDNSFRDIVSRKRGLLSVLCSSTGHIFTYNKEGELLYIFGGVGNVKGSLNRPAALDSIGEKIVVLDSATGQITVYKPTEYAKMIHRGISSFNDGFYENSLQAWQEVIRRNANFELAYRREGVIFLQRNEYKTALEKFRAGRAPQNYSDAFREYRKIVIRDHFRTIMILILIALVIIWMIYLLNKKKILQKYILPDHRDFVDHSRKNKLFKLYQGGKFSLRVIFHPFAGFWELKHEKKGFGLSAAGILSLVIITYIFMRQYTGFVILGREPEINIFQEVFSVLIPFGLWCIVNWSITTILDGKGSLKDVFIATAYALTPIILINIPLTVVSNYILREEMNFYYFFWNLGVFWMVILLLLGNMVTHEFDILKGLKIFVATIIGMGVVLFLVLLFLSVLTEMGAFINNIISEIFILR